MSNSIELIKFDILLGILMSKLLIKSNSCKLESIPIDPVITENFLLAKSSIFKVLILKKSGGSYVNLLS